MTPTGGPSARRPWAKFMGSGRGSYPLGPANETAWGRFFEGFSTAGQTRVGHEVFLGIERLLTVRGLNTDRRPIRQELPTLLVILEVCGHDLVEELFMHRRIENRAQHLDSAVEIARHHIGGGNIDRGLCV